MVKSFSCWQSVAVWQPKSPQTSEWPQVSDIATSYSPWIYDNMLKIATDTPTNPTTCNSHTSILSRFIKPICCMYRIFAPIWVIHGLNAGKYSSTMEHMGTSYSICFQKNTDNLNWFIWFIYVFYMVYIWSIYGLYMNNIWIISILW